MAYKHSKNCGILTVLLTTFPRFVIFLLAFSLAIFILCWADMIINSMVIFKSFYHKVIWTLNMKIEAYVTSIWHKKPNSAEVIYCCSYRIRQVYHNIFLVPCSIAIESRKTADTELHIQCSYYISTHNIRSMWESCHDFQIFLSFIASDWRCSITHT